MSWDDAAKAVKNVGRFVSIKDGDSATLAILGEPMEVQGKFGPCLRINAVYVDGGGAKILELSPKWFKKIIAVQPQLATHAITISRTGEGTATNYNVTVARELTATERTELAQVQLVDLSEQKPATTEDAPF